MGKSSPDSADPIKVAQAQGEAIKSMLAQYPALFSADAVYGPQNVGQGLANTNLALWGTPAGQRTVQTQNPVSGWVNTRTGATVTQLPYDAQNLNQGPARDRQGGGQWQPTTLYQPGSQTVDVPAQEGLVDMYGRLAPEASRINSATRSATYGDLRNLNPGQASLYDSLNESAQAGLAAGSRIDPTTLARINSGVRSNWASRGVGNAPAAGLDEALQQFGGGQALLQQRQQTAGNVAQLGSSLYTLPALMYSPQTSAGDLLGVGAQFGHPPSVSNQLGLNAGDQWNTLYNAEASNNINAANAHNATVSGAAQTGVGIASAIGIAL